jgi:transposase-like protein
MKKSRRKFSSEEKVRILRRHLVDKVAVSDLCDEYSLHPTQFYRWQKEFFEHGASAFERQNNSLEQKYERKVSALEAKLSKKDEVIAEIMESQVELKKKLGLP